MATISLTLPVSGTVITAGLHSTNYTTIQNVINGGLDNNNVSASAAIDGTKLLGVARGVRVLTVSGTYTPTTGTNRVYVECVGGGGSGGSVAAQAAGQTAAGTGGGGGGYSASFLSSGFSGAAFVIGAGGAAPAAGNNNGNPGTDTTFAATVVVAKGGAGGQGSPVNGAFPIVVTNQAAGGAAVSGTGDVKTSGGFGQGAITLAASQFVPGFGGVSVLGNGGVGLSNGTGGGNGTQAPTNGGGGGGAGVGAGGAAQQGGAGANGVIRIWEFA